MARIQGGKMLKKIVAIIICVGMFSSHVFAEELLSIQLRFPQKSYAKAAAPTAIPKPIKVSGNVIIDITPYPEEIAVDRYLVEYFLDEQIIFQNTGYSQDDPDNLFFEYLLDTTVLENGKHKIIVNFWDESGASAIGIQNIIVNNENVSGEVNE